MYYAIAGKIIPDSLKFMKLTFFSFPALCCVLFAWDAHLRIQAEPEMKNDMEVDATLELKDGSKLIGVALEKSLPVTLDFTKVSIPMGKIRQCEINHKDKSVVISLQNGDRLAGTLDMDKFEINTVLGQLSPEVAQIDRMTFLERHAGAPPAGEGTIPFGEVNWQAWRIPFEIQGEKLVSLPKARPGFNYGHDGNGRGSMLMTNIGSLGWKDYRMDVDYCVTGVNPAFDPYALGADFHDGSILFHVADANENWNQRGSSYYILSLAGDGGWTLQCVYNDYCRVKAGWGNPQRDAARTLASGRGLKPDRVNGNHYRIEVRGQRIQIWVDGQQIVDVTDEKMGATIGGQTLDHGGVGFQGGYEAIEWIKNFSVSTLPITEHNTEHK